MDSLAGAESAEGEEHLTNRQNNIPANSNFYIVAGALIGDLINTG